MSPPGALSRLGPEVGHGGGNRPVYSRDNRLPLRGPIDIDDLFVQLAEFGARGNHLGRPENRYQRLFGAARADLVRQREWITLSRRPGSGRWSRCKQNRLLPVGCGVSGGGPATG